MPHRFAHSVQNEEEEEEQGISAFKGIYGSAETKAHMCINMHIGVCSVLGELMNSCSKSLGSVLHKELRACGEMERRPQESYGWENCRTLRLGGTSKVIWSKTFPEVGLTSE